MERVTEGYVHLLRLALEGRSQDVAALARKNLKSISQSDQEMGEDIRKLLSNYDLSQSITRSFKEHPLPIDVDSKLELLKREEPILPANTVWPESVIKSLSSIVEERKFEKELLEKNLFPTRSILFVGPPGVGKTIAAKWLSYALKRPLLTLDLAAVMSSFLGKTGNNIRAVLNYSQKVPSVLLLDEFDAIAKRRNDDTEVGELKRLVTVLLQAVDDWPPSGVLIAATNHPELLDPAVWRRFERVIRFPTPSVEEINLIIKTSLDTELIYKEEALIEALSMLMEGQTHAEVVKQINAIRRENVVLNKPISILLEELLSNNCKEIPRDKKNVIAKRLMDTGLSQRRISELIGVSRDTLRKYVKIT